MLKKNSKGFTLVELLVVIAIIGILAVVAVPALFKNIEKGKVADLESDISAIRSAVLSYYTDNSEYPIDDSTATKSQNIFTAPSYSHSSPNPNIVELKKDMSYITDNDGVGNIIPEKKKATLQLISELEGLSFPYEGTYKLTDKNGYDVVTSPSTLYLTIITKDSSTIISDSGLDKLAQDLGLTRGSSISGDTTMAVTDASGSIGQIIIIPLINK